MKLFRITYKDWAYGEYFFAGTVWATSMCGALVAAAVKFDVLGKSYNAEELL